jgi:hypothetical protein
VVTAQLLVLSRLRVKEIIHILPPYDSMTCTGILPLPVNLLYRRHNFTYQGGWQRGEILGHMSFPNSFSFSLFCIAIHERYYVKSCTLRILTLNLLQMTPAGLRAITNTHLETFF